jgi:hypothetical protein
VRHTSLDYKFYHVPSACALTHKVSSDTFAVFRKGEPGAISWKGSEDHVSIQNWLEILMSKSYQEFDDKTLGIFKEGSTVMVLFTEEDRALYINEFKAVS